MLHPVPEVFWVDPDGSALGRPALITSFVDGVTKPSNTSSNITGFGTGLDEALRQKLVVQFVDHLKAIHATDIHVLAQQSFHRPNADPQQAARWHLNWWTTVWHNDALRGIPSIRSCGTLDARQHSLDSGACTSVMETTARVIIYSMRKVQRSPRSSIGSSPISAITMKILLGFLSDPGVISKTAPCSLPA